MQQRNDDHLPHSHQRYTHNGYSNNRHLPSPIPISTATSPMTATFAHSPRYGDMTGSLQSPSGGLTDPQGWASTNSNSNSVAGDKAGFPRTRGGPGSSGMSPRTAMTDHLQRQSLPSLNEIPSRRALSSWDDPSPLQHHQQQQGRTGFPYGSPSVFRFSPPKPPPLITPKSSIDSGDPALSTHRRNSLEHTRLGNRDRDSIADRQITESPAPPASVGGTKHAHSTPGGPGESGPSSEGLQKKKKRRVALSCAECAKRKQKCNRETPCQHCISRRVPELCLPYTRPTSPQGPAGRGIKTEAKEQSAGAKASPRDKKDGSGSQITATTKDEVSNAPTTRPPSMLPTISVRVGRLEQLLNAVVNRVDGIDGKALRDWRINHPPATSPPPLSRRPSSSQIVYTGGIRDRDGGDPPDTASTRSRRQHSTEWMQDLGEPEEVIVGGLENDTAGRNPVPLSMIHANEPIPLGLDYHGTPAEQLQKLFQDCGVSPHKIQELLSDLPPKEFAERLVEWYFQKINFVRYPIDEYLFKQAFEAVYAEGTNVSSVLALPLVFIVLALAIRVSPDELMGTEDQKRTMSLRMYWNSKTAVIMASAVKAENLQLVETRILTGLYLVLMHERRLAEGWAEFRSALTVGQAIGLHRDGTKLGLDPYLTEYRRRLWSYLIHADATYSCLLGRPTSINLACVDTQQPSNLDLPDLLRNKNAKPRPMSEPTFATYLILREKLGIIVAKITQHFQSLQGDSQYRDVELLDAELKALVNDLPPSFKMLTPDKSHDHDLWWLVIHRYYIQTEILHFIIILHRPWLLRKLRSQRYALSRTACFDAALTDHKLRQMFKQDCPDFFETLVGGSFREFNVAMIAGISIIIDPRASRASDMRQVVQSFLEQHPHDSRADNFSQKEAAIIHVLWRRSVEMEEKRTRRQALRMPRDNTSFERGAPLPHQQSNSGDSTGGSGANMERSTSATETITDTPSTSLTAHSYVRGGQTNPNSGSGKLSGQGSTPEDDHPQKLLDHWLVSNLSFGPGADSTLNPYTGVVQQGQMYSSIYNPTSFPPNMVPPPDQIGGVTGQGGYYNMSNNTGIGGWVDPSLSSMNGSGQVVNPQSQSQDLNNLNMMNVPIARGAGGGGVSYGAGAGAGLHNGLIGDGDVNNAQFWNTLIDGIVGGLPTYDPNIQLGQT